jgi:hypothetical protein
VTSGLGRLKLAISKSEISANTEPSMRNLIYVTAGILMLLLPGSLALVMLAWLWRQRRGVRGAVTRLRQRWFAKGMHA